MDKDQGIGLVIFIASVAGILAYGYLLIIPNLTTLVLQITAFLAVGAILAILAWIGWTMATTPPPSPIEAELPPVQSAGTPSESTTVLKDGQNE